MPEAAGVTDHYCYRLPTELDSAHTTFTVVVYKQPELRTDHRDVRHSGLQGRNICHRRQTDCHYSPAGSMMSKYFQARIDPESVDCGTEAPQNNDYLCLSVDLFNLAADPIDENSGRQNAKMVLTLDNRPKPPRFRTPSKAPHSFCIRATERPTLGPRY